MSQPVATSFVPESGVAVVVSSEVNPVHVVPDQYALSRRFVPLSRAAQTTSLLFGLAEQSILVAKSATVGTPAAADQLPVYRAYFIQVLPAVQLAPPGPQTTIKLPLVLSITISNDMTSCAVVAISKFASRTLAGSATAKEDPVHSIADTSEFASAQAIPMVFEPTTLLGSILIHCTIPVVLAVVIFVAPLQLLAPHPDVPNLVR